MDDLIDMLAVYRLTRLVVHDEFPPIKKAREKAFDLFPPPGRILQRYDGWRFRNSPNGMFAIRWKTWPIQVPVISLDAGESAMVTGGGHPIGYLLQCDWCSSAWIAVAAVGVRRFLPRAWKPLARVLAASAVSGIVAERVSGG